MLLQTKCHLFSPSSTEKSSGNFIYNTSMNGSSTFNIKSNITADTKHIEKSAPKISACLNGMSPHFRYQLIVMNWN